MVLYDFFIYICIYLYVTSIGVVLYDFFIYIFVYLYVISIGVVLYDFFIYNISILRLIIRLFRLNSRNLYITRYTDIVVDNTFLIYTSVVNINYPPSTLVDDSGKFLDHLPVARYFERRPHYQ